uniref:G-protein coupled receptors family 1 profile domain-containing protein n=1 Tax=Panagrolaimus sp. PS1159 TaxID=55785 RepID=A0AC35GAL5_9BILA
MITLHKCRNSMSVKTRQLQKQISRVLFVQAFVPFVTKVIPLIFDILTIYFGMYMPDSGTLFLIASAWSPVVNPVVTLLAVTQYRQSVIRYFNQFSPIKIDVKQQTSLSLTNMDNQLTAISA